jgi:PAS domain S-box-containing protein
MASKPTNEESQEKIRGPESRLELCEKRENVREEKYLSEARNCGQRFRDLIEGSIQGILIHRDHKPLFVNRQWAAIHGYSTEEILKMQSIIPLISPKDQARLIEYKDVRLKGGNAPINYEYEGVRKDGSLIWLENRVMVVQWDGEPSIQTTIFDITDRKRAEKALKESQNRYRAVIEDLPALICSFLPGGEITFVNKAYCDYFEKSCEELVGSNFLFFIPGADRKPVMENISALTVASPTQTHEHQVIAKNGDICWQRWTNRAIFDDRENVVGYQSIGVDITERKKAHEALRESEELHRITLSNISDAVFMTDDVGNFTYICPNVSVIFGYSYEEVIDLRNIENLLGVHYFDRSELESSGEIKNLESVIRDKYGKTHIILVNIKLVSIKGGTMLFTCHDITERRRAYEELLESEERYRQLFDNASDAVMIFDAQSKQFEDANPAASELFGYSKDEFPRLTVGDITEEKNREGIAVGEIEKNISVDKYAPLHYFKKKNGALFPGEIYAGSFFSNGRKKIIGAVRDITNRLKAEEIIRDLSFSLLSAQEMERKRIASDLHDDLGQTLAYLKIRISNLQSQLPKVHDQLRQECENTLEYTNQLIERVRQISHGLTPIFLDDLGLTASLHSLIEELSEYSSIKIEKHTEDIDALFSPEVEITIYRIVQEIFNNIRKHSEANSAAVEIKKREDNVSFKIEDSGNGFDVDSIELFYANKKGLGLASLHERVRMLGGRFEIYSQINEGTKIHFTIPFD